MLGLQKLAHSALRSQRTLCVGAEREALNSRSVGAEPCQVGSVSGLSAGSPTSGGLGRGMPTYALPVLAALRHLAAVVTSHLDWRSGELATGCPGKLYL